MKGNLTGAIAQIETAFESLSDKPNFQLVMLAGVHDLARALMAREPDISAALEHAASEGEDSETLKATLDFKLKWNLSKSTLETDLNWSVKHSEKAVHRIDVNGQPDLFDSF
jgi:hypothetical protein